MIPITVLILTFNEEQNIGRTLEALKWAKEILIVDSGSTDRTLEVARAAHPNVRVVHRPFDNHPNQWNFGLDQVTTEWVLTLDADYEVSPQLAAEIHALNPAADQIGYWTEFEYRIFGHPLRGSSYPPRIVLFKPAYARYVDDGHTQTLWIRDRAAAELRPPGQMSDAGGKTAGLLGELAGKIFHDDRKPLSRWLQEQDRYARLEARHLLAARAQPRSFKIEDRRSGTTNPTAPETPLSAVNSQRSTLTPQDRLRLKIFFAGPAMFLYLLFGRGLILDGWPGWFYVAQRTIAELLLSMRLLIKTKKLEDGSGDAG
jgi:glycosyltransferase involved in cell wall biosynthesis